MVLLEYHRMNGEFRIELAIINSRLIIPFYKMSSEVPDGTDIKQ